MPTPNDNLNTKSEALAQPSSNHAFMMEQLRQSGVLGQLKKAGLLDAPELEDNQEAGAGSEPAPKSGLAPNITSVPQPDR
jgi:hypothetical protein